MDIRWTWAKDGKGSLTTVFKPDGKVSQERRFRSDDEISDEPVGTLPVERYQQLLRQAEDCLGGAPSDDQGETVQLTVGDRTTGPTDVDRLGRAMHVMRRKVRARREKAAGGFFAWNSLGGRLAGLFLLLVLCFSYWIVRDWRYGDQLQVSGQREDATVIAQKGDNVRNCELVLDVPGHGETSVKEYLSLENWKAATPGSSVRVWIDPKTGKTFLEKDMLRWQEDKKLIPILPLSFALVGFIVCYFAQRYRIGVYPGGDEYLTRGDTVACDDKDALVNRTNYQMAKMLWLLGKH